MSTIQSSSNEESIPLTTLIDENVEGDKTPEGGNVNISGVKGENPMCILTKVDMANFATKADLAKELANFATKEDLANFATKKDLANFATKKDLDVFMKKIEKVLFYFFSKLVVVLPFAGNSFLD
ncbi:unnamed protein product [Meloidogyne enterolobii]|uniref:Uncharacterized protein n=1 Tax=Meloidogyne enterolobii TaxID=390850 RepID=A0ACB0YHY1_MELEN